MGTDDMNGCNWEPIHGFQGPGEVQRFLEWLAPQLARADVEELPVAQHYAGTEVLRERWFRCVKDGTIWRLVEPDFPFRGVFEPVSK
jgi:hypothetical protein